MARTRAWRRWRRERIRRRRKHYFVVQAALERGDQRWVGAVSETPRPCSCPVCRNWRWPAPGKDALSRSELWHLATEANEECE